MGQDFQNNVFREAITNIGFSTTSTGEPLSYIEANRPDVEAEYQIVLKQAEENRQYWQERNRNHAARVATMPPKPGRETLWVKLQQQKARHQLEA